QGFWIGERAALVAPTQVDLGPGVEVGDEAVSRSPANARVHIGRCAAGQRDEQRYGQRGCFTRWLTRVSHAGSSTPIGGHVRVAPTNALCGCENARPPGSEPHR